LASFLSEWVKLKRKTLLLTTFLSLAALSALFVVLIFSNAPAHGSGGGLPSLQQLARPNGLVFGLTRATTFLGVVAFGIAAAQTASEYSLGTLRQLLVRQPRRVTLLIGKMLAVVTFMVLATAFAAVVAFAAANVMAQSRGVSTSAWFTGTGFGDLLNALGNIVLAVIGYSVLGLVIGQFLRSAVAAVIVGFAWLMVIEQHLAGPDHDPVRRARRPRRPAVRLTRHACGLDVHGRHVRLAGVEYIAFAEYAQRTGER
jgi:hypothetical protein